VVIGAAQSAARPACCSFICRLKPISAPNRQDVTTIKLPATRPAPQGPSLGAFIFISQSMSFSPFALTPSLRFILAGKLKRS
jgi:hypothetical protein